MLLKQRWLQLCIFFQAFGSPEDKSYQKNCESAKSIKKRFCPTTAAYVVDCAMVQLLGCGMLVREVRVHRVDRASYTGRCTGYDRIVT